MFRKLSTAALFILTALSSFTLATAQEAKETDSKKQIAVDLGREVKLKMTLIPSGEFKMAVANQRRPRLRFSTRPMAWIF